MKMTNQANNKTAIAFLDIFLLIASVISFMGASGAFIAENYDRAIFLVLAAIWIRLPYQL